MSESGFTGLKDFLDLKPDLNVKCLYPVNPLILQILILTIKQASPTQAQLYPPSVSKQPVFQVYLYNQPIPPPPHPN